MKSRLPHLWLPAALLLAGMLASGVPAWSDQQRAAGQTQALLESQFALVHRLQIEVRLAQAACSGRPPLWEETVRLADRLFWLDRHQKDLDRMLGSTGGAGFEPVNFRELRRLHRQARLLASTTAERRVADLLEQRLSSARFDPVERELMTLLGSRISTWPHGDSLPATAAGSSSLQSPRRSGSTERMERRPPGI